MKYYELIKADIAITTDKAYGICTGTNGAITRSNLKYYYDFIAKSICKEVNEKIFVPVWIAKNFSSHIDWNNFIEVDEPKKAKKSKEQKEIEFYNQALNNSFNGEIPDQYIEYWFNIDDSLYGIRFTTINKLDRIQNHEDVIKLNIVKNGITEHIV